MKLKNFLLLPLIVTLILFIYFSAGITEGFRAIINSISVTPEFAFYLLFSIILLIAGHLVRSYKMSYLLSPIKESSTRFQFRALSIGYLFNSIMPLRIGELIRAQVIAGGKQISYGLALLIIIFERAVDLIFLSALLFILSINNIIPLIGTRYSLIFFITGTAFITIMALVATANKYILSAWHKVTSLFNVQLKQSFRFKAWSLIYGLQTLYKRADLTKYFTLTILSWCFYLASAAIISLNISNESSLIKALSSGLGHYIAMGIPAGPANLGTFSIISNQLSPYLGLNNITVINLNLVTWAILVIPTSILGLGALLFKTNEPIWRSMGKNASENAFKNKLLRIEDVSKDLDDFLDNYFLSNKLSMIVHKLELNNNFRLLKYFRGGSDAITILALENDYKIVKKIIPIEYKDRLQAQFKWLSEQGSDVILKTLREQEEADYYSIDLEYDENNQTFFDFIHCNSIEDSKKVFDEVWASLFNTIHKDLVTKNDSLKVDEYINKHVIGCLEKATLIDKELEKITHHSEIIINGHKYDNLYGVIEKIRSNKSIIKDIATYNCSGLVHGDVTVDNILVSKYTKKPIIIDPAPDGNIFNGPVFDFGKNLQSLLGGYEFIVWKKEHPKINGNEINFNDQTSNKYSLLCDYIINQLAPKHLSPQEQRAIIFHAGSLYIRRLKHQVVQNPENTVALYAIGVKILNEFLAQYSVSKNKS